MCSRKLSAVFLRRFDDQERAVARVMLANYKGGVHLEDIVQVTEVQTEHN